MLNTRVRSKGCRPYPVLMLKGSGAVASLVACTSAPVPSAFDQVKFDCMLTPFQSEVFTLTNRAL